jgi:menaquinone-dependent protoporphyrinogen oxidase
MQPFHRITSVKPRCVNEALDQIAATLKIRCTQGGIMKTMILFTTKHGSAADCAEILASHLNGDVSVIDLGTQTDVALDDADTVILGSSVYAGKIQPAMTLFMEKHASNLLKKRLGLWVNCSQKGDEGRAQFNRVYPQQLREHATATGFFGDAVHWETMNFIEKLAMRIIAKTKGSYEHYDREAIAQFAKDIT